MMSRIKQLFAMWQRASQPARFWITFTSLAAACALAVGVAALLPGNPAALLAMGLAFLILTAYSAAMIIASLWRKAPRLSLGSAAVGAVFVWLAVQYGWLEIPRATTLSYTKHPEFVPVGDQLGCKAIASAFLQEEITLGERDKYRGKVTVSGERGTDTLSMKVDHAARKLLVLTGAGVRMGTIDPEEMTIIRDDKDALVAIQIIPKNANVFIVRLDRQTGNAVWGKVGEFILGGQVGWAHYLECR